MSINSKRFWKRRSWLNPIKSMDNGYILIGNEGDCAGDFFLKIGDCSRILSLNIYFNSKQGQDLALKKVRKLINELTLLESKMGDIDPNE